MKRYLKAAGVLLLIVITTFSMVACKKPPMQSIGDIDKQIRYGI